MKHKPIRNGTATTKQLYIGNYSLVEVKAPEGFVLDATPKAVFIVYGGQDVAVTTTQAGLSDTRQNVEIDLQKDIQVGYDRLWDQAEAILRNLAKMQG